MEPTKVKLSVTLAPDLVRAIDRARRRHPGESRSSIIEAWLRRGARRDEEERLRAETIAYYEARSTAEVREDAAIARAASRAARRLEFDDE